MNWEEAAARLAVAVADDTSVWRPLVAQVPRHAFVPRWWERDGEGWELRDGPADTGRWARIAYSDRSVITAVAGRHADQAQDGERPAGRPTSSATLPGLTVRMLDHARLAPGLRTLDIGTGSGYGTALACLRVGAGHVTSMDVDPATTTAAVTSLGAIGLRPAVFTGDATGTLPGAPGAYDRIVSTVAVRTVPASWLTALRTGGRLVTTLAGTSLIVTATKTPHGGAVGGVEWDRAGFMHARTGPGDYPPGPGGGLAAAARAEEGDSVTAGLYPVVDVAQAWDLDSFLSLTAPGITHEFRERPDGKRVAVMTHAEGSWARAEGFGGDRPIVHQSGPRRLWDLLEHARAHWLFHGELPVRGARAHIRPDGRTTLTRGDWHVTLRP
ncbi:methyltransferase domain-containing protein [Streptomyces sp. MS19]|uniref:methyltransferase domain-containing protein n=1 Tax=Streptomyces sp. MS19 TaxID=3385972 RepID=UPI0039A1755D